MVCTCLTQLQKKSWWPIWWLETVRTSNLPLWRGWHLVLLSGGQFQLFWLTHFKIVLPFHPSTGFVGLNAISHLTLKWIHILWDISPLSSSHQLLLRLDLDTRHLFYINFSLFACAIFLEFGCIAAFPSNVTVLHHFIVYERGHYCWESSEQNWFLV